ncbi:IS1 family transposase, partial [Escherichia coli]|uniref:IS1 family transposase n=1 Tax=Escherichia coli TaxID=562 RepID=UPI002492A57C
VVAARDTLQKRVLIVQGDNFAATQSVTSRIQPGSDVIVCAEMDEQWGYVGAKSRQRWLFYAYDRIRRTVVAHVFGER